ncbi:MAG: FtsL-like putative cell division protein [Bacteroidales bacterium]|nr:FtsL-like putative cell division protein [Bacteroidales bacterium]
MSREGEIKANSYLRPGSKNPFTRKKVGKSMHSMLDGTFLTRDKFKRALPFILFLMVLGVIYITNIFHVEKTKRQIDDLEEELRELRYEYISSRSKLMYESKPSEIAIKLEETGIRESMVPPRKIMVSKDNKTK